MKNAQATKEATVSLHPASGKNILCFQLDGFVTRNEHKKFLIDPLREAVKKYGNYRVIMIYKPTFEGWEAAAADDNMKIVLECMNFCERAAYVNPPKKKIMQMKMSEPLIKFDIRYFDTAQTDEALAWIRQDAK